jgi:lipopolysaccharide export system permease protein
VKIFSRLLLRAFLGPFALTFLIVLFVLVMQFLWVYIDDLVGKGLEWYIISEVLFYASASFVPLALPLAILLASIMTFGNLGEFYELTAIKSAGISLWRFTLPLTFFIVLVSVGAFYFSNTLLPVSRLKFHSLLYDIQQKKPALSIKEGLFYTDIENYAIRVGSKSDDNQQLQDVLIYDHTAGRGNTMVIVAKSGQMKQSTDERYLTLKLYDGYSYEEMPAKDGNYYRRPHMRTSFKEQEIHFDLSAFSLKRSDEELFKEYYSMLNIKQLDHAIDSLEGDYRKRNVELVEIVRNFYQFKNDSTFVAMPAAPLSSFASKPLLEQVPENDRQDVLRDAINNVQGIKGYTSMRARELDGRRTMLNRHYLELHRKFALSFACFVLFLIGAPLGAIIRRGGLGLPMLFCIVLFLIYHVISMTSEKLARDSLVNVHLAMWISSLVLLPVGLFLTVKANNDSRLFDAGSYLRWFKRLRPGSKVTTN